MREGQGMGDKTEFPHRLFEAYAEKRITRSEFMVRFSAWQKARGIDYGCRGTADKAGTYVTYRGLTATLRGDRLMWCAGVKPAGRRCKRLDIRSAAGIFEFRRKVDSALLREYLWKGGDRCREMTW